MLYADESLDIKKKYIIKRMKWYDVSIYNSISILHIHE